MALQHMDGQSFDFSISESDFHGGSQAVALLNYDEARFSSKAGYFQNESLPSVFDRSLNCSDWTLRLSQSSLVQPVSSTKHCENNTPHVDHYMKERSHDLGNLHKYSSNRPNFDMPCESPSTDRSPIACYCPDDNTHTDWRYSDVESNATLEFSHELEKTVTTLSGSVSDYDSCATSLQSADFTRVTGSLVQSSRSNSAATSLPYSRAQVQSLTSIQSTACSRQSSNIHIYSPISSDKSTTNEQRIRTRNDAQIVQSFSDGKEFILSYMSDENVSREDRRKANYGHKMQSHGKENVEPSVEVLPRSTKERAMKRLNFIANTHLTQTAKYTSDNSFESATLNNDSGIVSHQNSMWRMPQLSSSTKGTKNRVQPTLKAVKDARSIDKILQGNRSDRHRLVEVKANEATVSSSPDHSGFDKRSKITTPPANTSDCKFSRSSSTPIKEVVGDEQEQPVVKTSLGCGDYSDGYKSLSSDRPVHNVYYSTQDSYACRLSTGSLTDSSYSDIDMTYESTVQLSLPSRVSRPVSKVANQVVIGTPTTLIPDCSNSHSTEVTQQPRTNSTSLSQNGPCTIVPRLEEAYLSRNGPYIIVPPELRIEEVCCVGLSSHGSLLVHNPSSRWQCIQLTVTHFSIDGKAEDQYICPFIVRSKVTIDPNAMEAVKVIFAPRIPGVHVAQLSLSSSLSMAGRPPIMVTLQAVAENAKVELVAEGNSPGQLKFRALPWGYETYECVSLVNKGRSTIPVRLVISSSKPNCFVFDKRLMNIRGVHLNCTEAASRVMMPMLHTCVMLGGSDDGAEHHRHVPVYFLAPKRSSSKSSGRNEEITGSILAQIDVPTNSARVLATLDIMGVVGTAKLHIPKDLAPIKFTTGLKGTLQFPLRNVGDIAFDIDLTFTQWTDLFTVHPTEISSSPGSECIVTVSFAAPIEITENKFDSYLVMRVKPDGPVYEVKLVSVKDDSLSTMPKTSSLATLSNLKSVSCDVGSCTSNAAVSRDIDEFVSNYKDIDSCLPQTNTLHIGNVNFQKTAAFDTIREATTFAENNSAIVDTKTLKDFVLPTHLKSSIVNRIAVPRHDKLGDFNHSDLGEVETGKGKAYLSHRVNNSGGRITMDLVGGYNGNTSNKSSAGAVDQNRIDNTISNVIASCGASWTIKPDNITLFASGDSPSVKRVTIYNSTVQDLQFDVSWPAHVLKVAPEHGIIRSRGSVLLYISTAVGESRRNAQLPWIGSIQVMCCNQIKVINVNVQEYDSPVSNNWSSKTPDQHSSVMSSISSPFGRVTTSNCESPIVTVTVPVVASLDLKTTKQSLRFPTSNIGDIVELHIEFTNVSSNAVKWSVSSGAPAYIKRSADSSCERLSYSVFWWPQVCGFIQPTTTEKVRVCFSAQEPGHHSQIWNVLFDARDSGKALQHTCRVEMFGMTSRESDPLCESRQQCVNGSVSDCTLLTQSSSIPSMWRPVPDTTRLNIIKSTDGAISITPKKLVFNESSVNKTQTCKLEMKNKGLKNYKVELSDVSSPFRIVHTSLTLRPRHFLRVPVEFTPRQVGHFSGQLVIRSDIGDAFMVQLYGVCV